MEFTYFCRNFGSIMDRVHFPMNSVKIPERSIKHSHQHGAASLQSKYQSHSMLSLIRFLLILLNFARFCKIHQNFYSIHLALNFGYVIVLCVQFPTLLVPSHFDLCNSSYSKFTSVYPTTSQNCTLRSKNSLKIGDQVKSYETYVKLKLIGQVFISKNLHLIFIRRA